MNSELNEAINVMTTLDLRTGTLSFRGAGGGGVLKTFAQDFKHVCLKICGAIAIFCPTWRVGGGGVEYDILNSWNSASSILLGLGHSTDLAERHPSSQSLNIIQLCVRCLIMLGMLRW